MIIRAHENSLVLASLLLCAAVSCARAGSHAPPDPLCTDVGLVCSGPIALECDAHGSVLQQTDCGAQGQLCAQGRGCQQCLTPGMSCLGDDWIRCSDAGEIETRQSCFEEGLVCAPEIGCTLCRPGSRSCDGDTVLACNESGTAWVPAETCDAGAGLHCDLTDGTCGNLCERAAESHSYIGCEYWPVTTANAPHIAEFDFAVVVSNPQAVEAEVEFRLGTSAETVVVPPLSVEQIRLPWVDWSLLIPWTQAPNGEWTFASSLLPAGAFRLRSSVPVTVYQFNPLEFRKDGDCEDDTDTEQDGECFSYSNDASLLLPTSALGDSYMVVSRSSALSLSTATNMRGDALYDAEGNVWERWHQSPGFVAIVGADTEPVEVEVTSSAYVAASADGSVGSMSPGEVSRFRLGPGDVLQLVSGTRSRNGRCREGQTNTLQGRCGTAPDEFDCQFHEQFCPDDPLYDLTGSWIRASGKIEVISGHACANVPGHRPACDHLEESVFPFETLGHSAIVTTTAPIREEPNVVRIVSGADDNLIEFDPPAAHEPVALHHGEFIEFEAREPFQVSGSGAVAVAQFMVGQTYSGNVSREDGAGDPSFAFVVPSEQYRQTYAVLAPDTFAENWLNIAAPASATVMLDGRPVQAFQAIGSSGMRVARVRVTGGPHSVASDGFVGVLAYGNASYTSYMYPGGLDLRPLY